MSYNPSYLSLVRTRSRNACRSHDASVVSAHTCSATPPADLRGVPLLTSSRIPYAKNPDHCTGFDDMGFQNEGQIPTPTFDFMHSHGIGLDWYYVQPSCSPTRATIMTGRKPVRPLK